MPNFEVEYVILENLAETEIDLRGWKLTDLEGSLAFEHDVGLRSSDRLSVCSNLSLFTSIHPGWKGAIYEMSDMARKGRFQLADDGDEVLLIDPSGRCQDALAFGKSDYIGEGWKGVCCQKPGEGKTLRRCFNPNLLDSNTSSDWTIDVPGRTELCSINSSGAVEPFLSPEHIRPRILRELAYACFSVKIAVYEITDPTVVDAICASRNRGVKVEIILEGQPVGGIPQSEVNAVSILTTSGCDVRFLKSYHGYKRYAYMHAKYLIVDDYRIMIMSENWARDSFENNRGWGITIEDRRLAQYYSVLFEADASESVLDVTRMKVNPDQVFNVPPRDNAANTVTDIGQAEPLLVFPASFTTVVSPDYSLSTIIALLSQASDRIYLQLFYFDLEAPELEDLDKALLDAAARGVKVRVLFDSSWYNTLEGKNNTASAALLNYEAKTTGSDLEARLVSRYHDFKTIHNKGAVVDDAVLISSINWAPSAFNWNREVGVIVNSAPVAEFFATTFEADWVDDPIPPSINVSRTNYSIVFGQRLVIDASNTSDNAGISRIIWDVDLDGEAEWQGKVFVADLSIGRHWIRITAIDKFNNSAEQIIEVVVNPVAREDQWALLPLLALASIPIAWRILKRVKNR